MTKLRVGTNALPKTNQPSYIYLTGPNWKLAQTNQFRFSSICFFLKRKIDKSWQFLMGFYG